jgi:hypothetical protein
MFLHYEELVGDTSAALARLSRFLDAEIPPLDLASLGRNSSHGTAGPRLEVTENEVWLATRPIRRELAALGFETPKASFRLGGAASLAGLYASTAAFHLRALLTDPDRRKRIVRLLQSSASQGRPRTRPR